MDSLPPATSPCWSCGVSIDRADHFCRHCGMGQGDHLPWFYHPAWIVALALFAAGPFVLPLVLKTPKLSTRGRWIFVAAIGLLTLYLVHAFVQLVATVKTTLGGNLNGIL